MNIENYLVGFLSFYFILLLVIGVYITKVVPKKIRDSYKEGYKDGYNHAKENFKID
jgi:hypothetical protein